MNGNFLSVLKAGNSKLALDRVPALASALECDPALLMRLALEQAVGSTAALALQEILTTLLVPLFAMHEVAKRIIAPATAYVDLKYPQVLALSTVYQGGVVA